MKVPLPSVTRSIRRKEGYDFTLPLTITVFNISQEIADLQIFISMNTKEPTADDNDLEIKKAIFKPGHYFKFVFGASGEEYLE